MEQHLFKNKWQEAWVGCMIILLITGLLWSRALLSIASVLILIPYICSYKTIRTDNRKLLAVILILLPVALSFFWSDNKAFWWNSLSVKLSLLSLLLGFSAVSFSKAQYRIILGAALLIITAGCCQSIWFYLQDTSAMEAAYLKAKTLPTPADNDHIRFSWLIVVCIVLVTEQLIRETKKIILFGGFLLVLLLIIYLHILAAKTGLVCLYAAALVWLCYMLFKKEHRKKGWLFLLLMVATGRLCYNSLPTLRNRLQYVVYDYSQYIQGNHLPGYNDAARLLSIKAGYSITKENALYGAGFGDILSQVDAWHTRNHPTSLPYERFLPANEWLVYGAGSGIAGMLCFTTGFFLLCYPAVKRNIMSLILCMVACIPFLIDDTLEGQYGVVILAFIVFFGQSKPVQS